MCLSISTHMAYCLLLFNCLPIPLQGREGRIGEEVTDVEVDTGDEEVGEVSDVDPPTPACSRDPLFTLDTPQAAQSGEFSGSNAIFLATTQQLFTFVENVNTCSKCSTEGCQGKLQHVSTRLIGLGGDCEVVFQGIGCPNRVATYPASPVHGFIRLASLGGGPQRFSKQKEVHQ